MAVLLSFKLSIRFNYRILKKIVIERLAKLKKDSMPKSLKMTMMKFGVMEFHFSERDAWSRKNNNDVRFAAHVIKMTE